ncbi:hypothetical protein M569_17246, partial [Genlisea aurea]
EASVQILSEKRKMSRENKAAELLLIVIASPGRGHLLAALEMANSVIKRDHRFSVTVINPRLYSSDDDRFPPELISHVAFVSIEPPPESADKHPLLVSASQKENVRTEVLKIVRNSGPDRRPCGLIVDLFSSNMIDIADEISVPSYVFYTCGASALRTVLHFQALRDSRGEDLKQNFDREIDSPSYKTPMPAKLVETIFSQGDADMFLDQYKRFRESRGILVNSVPEFESHALNSFASDGTIPPVLPVGPVIHMEGETEKNCHYDDVMTWLDEQPESSVVFLCFGSAGWF